MQWDRINLLGTIIDMFDGYLPECHCQSNFDDFLLLGNLSTLCVQDGSWNEKEVMRLVAWAF